MQSMSIAVISKLNDNDNIIQLLKRNEYAKYILNISQENNIITVSLLYNGKFEIKIADDTQAQLQGMYNYYSKRNVKSEDIRNNILNQIKLSNNLMYFHIDLTDDKLKNLSMAIMSSFVREVKGCMIYPNLTILNWNGEMLTLPKEKAKEKDSYEEIDEIYDHRFSDEDKIRINKNISILKQQGVPYSKNFDLIPTRNNTKLESSEKIFEKLIYNYVIASIATTFAYNDMDEEFYNEIYNSLNMMYGFEKYMSNSDKKLLKDIKKGRSIVNLSDLSWIYEECSIEMWMLGLWEFPNQQEECDIEEMNEIIYADPNNNSGLSRLFIKIADNLKEKTKNLECKTYEEILEKADLLNRYKWAYENKEYHGNFHKPVIYNQLRAFYDILNWNPDESCFKNEKNK